MPRKKKVSIKKVEPRKEKVVTTTNDRMKLLIGAAVVIVVLFLLGANMGHKNAIVTTDASDLQKAQNDLNNVNINSIDIELKNIDSTSQ